MRIFYAEVTREGRFWLIRVPELDRSARSARYKDVPGAANELIGSVTGLSTLEYDLYLRVNVPSVDRDHLARVEVIREEERRRSEQDPE